MSGPLKSLKQVAEFAHPRTLKQLRAAGALDPKGPLALARTLPWLVGRGASLGILSQVNAMVLPHKPALHDRNGTLTFKELDTRANRAARMLQAEGVSGGDRIALLLRNGREMIEIALGAQKIGVIACPLNTWAKTKELEATLGQADPKLLIYDAAHTEQVEKVTGNDVPLLA